MITGTLKNQVDDIWNVFWSGGISNPINVIEQMTYLLFMRQLDLQQTEVDQKRELGVPVGDAVAGDERRGDAPRRRDTIRL